jgi:hypothetical protein
MEGKRMRKITVTKGNKKYIAEETGYGTFNLYESVLDDKLLLITCALQNEAAVHDFIFAAPKKRDATETQIIRTLLA